MPAEVRCKLQIQPLPFARWRHGCTGQMSTGSTQTKAAIGPERIDVDNQLAFLLGRYPAILGVRGTVRYNFQS